MDHGLRRPSRRLLPDGATLTREETGTVEMRCIARLAILLTILGAIPAWAAGPEILIGVISPTGAGRAIGKAHELTIQFAFDRVGPTIEANGIAIPLRVEYLSDRGDPEAAVSAAKQLAQDGAVAILGPVDSRSTAAVVAAQLKVPVLAALSTAPSLGRPRDPWFFRLTLSDEERVRQFVETLYRYDGMMPAPPLVVYDGGNPYGEGLRDALVGALGTRPGAEMSWADLVAGGAVGGATREAVLAGRGFSAAGQASLDPTPGSVFLLGPNADGVPIAQGIVAFLHAHGAASSPRFFFVGADDDLRAGAPEGSITVGEPTVVSATESDAGKVQAEFARWGHASSATFVATAYDAARYVLPEAIADMIGSLPRSRGGELPSPEVLRERLRQTLENLEFGSIEHWRRIGLRGGELSGAPVVPVYRITRGLDLIEVAEPQPYLDLDIQQTVGFLEGPVSMRIRPHGLEEKPSLSVLRVDVKPYEVIPSQSRELPDGRTEVSFYPRWPGKYRLDTKLPTDPVNASTVVSPQWGYPIALLGALLGSLLFVLGLTGKKEKVSHRRIVLGMLTGVVLAGLAFNRSLLPQGVPVPTFGDSRDLTALWAGFAGGWFGPGVLLLLAGRLLPGIGDSRPAEAPADAGQAPPSSGTSAAELHPR